MRTSLLATAVLAGCGFEVALETDVPPIIDAPPEAITMCTPNETLCIGRTRATCNATGTGIDDSLTVLCPLACTAGGQCVSASNLPDDAQRACTAAAPALAPPANAMVQFRPAANPGGVELRCTPTCGAGTLPSIASTRITQNGPPIALFCLRSIDLPSSVTVTYDPAVTSALALLVVGNVQIAGQIALSGTAAAPAIAGQAGPAGGDGGGAAADDASGPPGSGSCAGSGGATVGTNASAAGGGGGGGGHAARGGDGGQGRADANVASGGSGGPATCGTSELSPLVGGSGGGAGGDGSCHPAVCGWPGGGGGGAIQISATTSITLATGAAIRAAGGAGFGSTTSEQGEGGGGGGGAGGAILLEAPTLALSGTLDVTGGAGGLSNAGPGGSGGVTALAGTNGAAQNAMREGGAGGGGAAGRVRLHASSSPSCAASSQPQLACTAGTLRATP